MSRSKHSILVVEDEAIVALELESRLTRLGYEVVDTVMDAAAALRVVDEQAARAASDGDTGSRGIDLALLDIRIQGPMDGIELARKLRERGVPCIFVTAHGDAGTLDRTVDAEAQGYLLKPFDERALAVTVRTALFRAEAEAERREAERAKHQAEAIQAAVLSQLPDAVLVVAPDTGMIRLSNQAAGDMLGIDADALVGRAVREFFAELELSALAGDAPPRLARRRVAARTGSGQVITTELAGESVSLGGGRGWVIVARDVTRELAVEEELARARELELAGRLATAVAHDLNTLLSVVSITTYVARRSEVSELPRLLEDLEGAVELGSSLTTRLLSFARQPLRDLEVQSVPDVIRSLENVIQRLAGGRVTVIVDLGREELAVSVHPGEIDQILLNLVVNASRAMPEGGTLRIGARRRAGFVELVVSDTGVGMDEQTLARAFDPFFSNRASGEGTGLGLHIVREIASAHGGGVEVDSAPGAGTTFRVLLPAVTLADARALRRDGRSTTFAGDGRTLLVVEDDELHRRALCCMLSDHGLVCHAATSAGEALLMVERAGVEHVAALIDVDLPYMGGEELADRIRQIRPSCAIVLMTGSERAVEVRGAGAFPVVSKPIEPARLLAALESVLS